MKWSRWILETLRVFFSKFTFLHNLTGFAAGMKPVSLIITVRVTHPSASHQLLVVFNFVATHMEESKKRFLLCIVWFTYSFASTESCNFGPCDSSEALFHVSGFDFLPSLSSFCTILLRMFHRRSLGEKALVTVWFVLTVVTAQTGARSTESHQEAAELVYSTP